MRHADARYLDAGIELGEQFAFERILAAQLAWLAGHFTGRIDTQLENNLLIECRFLCPVRCHFLLTCLALQDEVTRDLLIPVLNLFAWPPGLGVGVCQTRFEIPNRVSGIPHRVCDKASKEDDKIHISGLYPL
jgi:hypothetical protein